MTINEFVVMKKHKRSKDTSCRPPEGKTYLTIGQDFFSIQEYVSSQYNASLHRGRTTPMTDFYPAGTMFYTDIQTLRGLDKPIDYGSGIEYADGLAQAFGGESGGIQIGLWLNGTAGCQDILDGTLNHNLRQMFSYLVKKVAVSKIFLRVGYEFDNPSFGFSDSPATYKRAFRKIVKTCQQYSSHCNDKIAFVWHSWAAPRVVDNLNDFYPGDKYVDWVGLSVFQQVYPWAMDDNNAGEFAGGTLRQVQDVLEFAKQKGKPIVIAESTPFGGIDLQDVVGTSALAYLNNHTDANAWDLWFQPVLDLMDQYDIGMWSYINCDWNSQPMWKGVGFGNTLLSSSNAVMTKWKQHVLDNPRFLNHLECDRHHQSSSSSHSSSTTLSLQTTSTMAWDPTSLNVLLSPTFVWFLVAIVVAYGCHWICRIQKRRQSGYFEIEETEEEEGLGEIQKLFGSSSRLSVEQEELRLSGRRPSSSSSTRMSGRSAR